MPDMVTLKINDRAVQIAEPGDATLAQYLRDVERLTGVRVACDEAACGACTVLIGGRAVFACHVLLAQLDGEDVLTIEGLGGSDPVQMAFAEMDALQCGFCTPGMVLATKAAIDRGVRGRDALSRAISGNICRCGAYTRILDAAERCSQ